MVLGLSVETFTLLHVVISLVAIVAGIAAMVDMINARRPSWITHVFLISLALAIITRFMIPVDEITTPFVVSIAATILLWPAFFSFYLFQLEHHARWVFVVASVAALYLVCFVLVIDAFQNIPFLHALAPTKSAAPYVIVQTAILAAFGYFGWLAVERFHPPRMTSA